MVGARELIEGNTIGRNNATFSFAIGPSCQADDGTLFVGAAQCDQSLEYSLSYVDFAGLKFKPLAPEKAIVNGKQDDKNPLYNAALSAMCPLKHGVCVVAAQRPSDLWWLLKILILKFLP